MIRLDLPATLCLASCIKRAIHRVFYRYEDVLPVILRDGLNRMGRTHIHFAQGEYGSAAVISGAYNVCVHVRVKLHYKECAAPARCWCILTWHGVCKQVFRSLLAPTGSSSRRVVKEVWRSFCAL